MKKDLHQPFPWRLFLSELTGTALLLTVGLSAVILMSGAGTPVTRFIPDEKLRQVITGFMFGSTGALIAISPIGKTSGAHINPVVTLAFWLFRKLDSHTALVYILAQLMGATLGCLPLLLWREMGSSVAFGATLPGQGYSQVTVIWGEIITTFTMVSLLLIFVGFRQIRAFTPAIFPVLYAIMVPLESAISGTSTNPARSLGPAIVSGHWQGWWIYWIGPFIGALLASLICSFLARKITIAKLYHFDSDQDGLLRRSGSIAKNTV